MWIIGKNCYVHAVQSQMQLMRIWGKTVFVVYVNIGPYIAFEIEQPIFYYKITCEQYKYSKYSAQFIKNNLFHLNEQL